MEGVSIKPKAAGGRGGLLGGRIRSKRTGMERSKAPISFTLDAENMGGNESSENENDSSAHDTPADAEQGPLKENTDQLRQSDGGHEV
jgi:hypothetical protein